MDRLGFDSARNRAELSRALVSEVQFSTFEALQERRLGEVTSLEGLYRNKGFPYRIQPLVRYRLRTNRVGRVVHLAPLGETREVVELPLSPRLKAMSEPKKAAHSSRGGGGFLFTHSKIHLPPITLRAMM